jgi:hypothetical protein
MEGVWIDPVIAQLMMTFPAAGTDPYLLSALYR